jgi:hypothetical protein
MAFVRVVLKGVVWWWGQLVTSLLQAEERRFGIYGT